MISSAPIPVAALLLDGGWTPDGDDQLWTKDGVTLHWIPAAVIEQAARTVGAA